MQEIKAKDNFIKHIWKTFACFWKQSEEEEEEEENKNFLYQSKTYYWLLANPKRLQKPLKPINQPQPALWRPQFSPNVKSDKKIIRAISIRQPYAEAILKGEKIEECRSRKTNIRERVYIYASQTPENLEIFEDYEIEKDKVKFGVIIGSVEITDCIDEEMPELREDVFEFGSHDDIDEEEVEFPLYDAVAEEDFEKIKLLIKEGADINQKCNSGWRPLHKAIWKGNEEIIIFLIENGADTNALNDYNETPLKFVREKNVKKLLKKLGVF